MDLTFLKNINLKMREGRPLLAADDVCTTFRTGDLLEIGFMSKQCKNDMTGSCIMCDYGKASGTHSVHRYLDEMEKILKLNSIEVKYLLLCCNGSFLDEYQISNPLFCEILHKAQNSCIPQIIIETHYLDVTPQRLSLIKSYVKKPVYIEMGLETINPHFQEVLFMKKIDLKKYEKTIKLIQDYGYKVELNIMVGLPFLNAKQQLHDAENSIKWALDHGCDPIIFPINIKPHTLLRYAYEHGFYQPISLWLIILLLDRLDKLALEKILIAWYGNRDEPYENDIPTILPGACNCCRNKLNKFFREFLDGTQYDIKKTLLNRLLQNRNCACIDELAHQLNSNHSTFDSEFNRFYTFLKKQFMSQS